MNSTNTPQAALLDALKAIVAECMDNPPEPRYSHDSYLPKHLLEAAQKAIEQMEIVSEAERFATLQAQFALHGHALHKSGPGDGPGPISYLAERWGLARYLPTLEDADKFLLQVGGGRHE
ncbi:MAG: hypothetical protein ABIR56_05585 [Polaromonas sp.]